MNKLFLNLMFLAAAGKALAGPAQIYPIYGPVSTPPVINAVVFYNASTFNLTTVLNVTNFNNAIGTGFSSIPFSTFNTLYFTNTSSGTMSGEPGFRLDTVTSTSRHSADSFDNDGTIIGYDAPAFPSIYSTTSGTTPIVEDSQLVASQVIVSATNILNDGFIAVGNAGLLQLNGSNVNNAYGALVAGAVNTGGTSTSNADTLDTTGDSELFYSGFEYYVNPPQVYDLFWGITNVATLDLTTFDPPQTPPIGINARDGFTEGKISLPINGLANFASYVDEYPTDASNTYFNIVFVNTNFTDVTGAPNTNLSATVVYSGFEVLAEPGDDPNAASAIVQFAEPVTDVITGQTVTNAVYLLDVGAVNSTFVEYDNAGSSDGYMRPNAFSITTTTPNFFLFSETSNASYSPDLIYAPNSFSASKVLYSAGIYGAQIGRNPGQFDGSFTFEESFSFDGTNISEGDTGLNGLVSLPDPTNEPARIEINAQQLNMTNARIRAEGLVMINASNMVGNASAVDWGEINANVGSTTGFMLVSNVFPTNFQRVRGDIYAYSMDFVNVFTNNATNTYHYHILVVDQNLGGNFQSGIRNLRLTATNAIQVIDPLYIVGQDYFNTTELTFSSNVVFTQNAQSVTPTNMPNLKYFNVTTNGAVQADGTFDIGFDVTKAPSSPLKRTYSVVSITNLGTITAATPLFQSQYFENDGSIVANSNGSIIIEASSLGMGLALTNATNSLISDENVTLSANDIGIVDSQIVAGKTNVGRGVLSLQTTSIGELTDFLPGVPSTNTYTTNQWLVTDGFSLPVKPATGDLFGTEITTFVTSSQISLHTWAGADLGPTAAGFLNNVVIGHLKLSSQSTNAELHFTGAGTKNGMYIDYLELDEQSQSFSNYRSGLVIDPSLTIYFAACNVDPIKLETIYTNRLVWVPSFSGPNSSVAVPYENSSNFCLLNANLADSEEISFFGGEPNAENQPYVLNDPNNSSNTYPCPTGATSLRDYIIPTSLTNDSLLQISTVGGGRITPDLNASQIIIGKRYVLTAIPSNGWIFAGWTTIGLAGNVDTSARELRFTLEGDAEITANFVAKTFTQVEGAYHGLFMDSSNQLGSANSGAFVLNVNEAGAFSGRLLAGPDNYDFSGRFSAAGSAQVTAHHGTAGRTVNLLLDMTGNSGTVTGYVDNSSEGLLGYLPGSGTLKAPSQFAGKFTFILTNAGSNTLSIGNSYGTATVSKAGVVTAVGKLADGTPFTQSVPLSENGLWPFYTYSAVGRDFLIGWITVQNGFRGVDLVSSNIFWQKTPGKGSYYPAGFTNTFLLTGSTYTTNGESLFLTTLEAPLLTLDGGQFATAISNAVTAQAGSTFEASNISLSINAGSGSFTGHYHQAGSASLEIGGVVLQNQAQGSGFFLGSDGESGTVLLQGQ